MTHEEFDEIYEESKCNGSRDAIIAYLFDQRKTLRAENYVIPRAVVKEVLGALNANTTSSEDGESYNNDDIIDARDALERAISDT
jgi:hypothetical protein